MDQLWAATVGQTVQKMSHFAKVIITTKRNVLHLKTLMDHQSAIGDQKCIMKSKEATVGQTVQKTSQFAKVIITTKGNVLHLKTLMDHQSAIGDQKWKKTGKEK